MKHLRKYNADRDMITLINSLIDWDLVKYLQDRLTKFEDMGYEFSVQLYRCNEECDVLSPKAKDINLMVSNIYETINRPLVRNYKTGLRMSEEDITKIFQENRIIYWMSIEYEKKSVYRSQIYDDIFNSFSNKFNLVKSDWAGGLMINPKQNLLKR